MGGFVKVLPLILAGQRKNQQNDVGTNAYNKMA
jgi:hypothetical protein